MLKSHKRKMKNTKNRNDRHWFNKQADEAERVILAEKNLMRAKYAVDQSCDMILAGKPEEEAETYLFGPSSDFADIKDEINNLLEYDDENPKLKQVLDLLEERHYGKVESGDKANNSNP